MRTHFSYLTKLLVKKKQLYNLEKCKFQIIYFKNKIFDNKFEIHQVKYRMSEHKG